MRDFLRLTRNEILDELQWLRQYDDFLQHRDRFLQNAVTNLDLSLAQSMLELGASPNRFGSSGDSYLHDLCDTYVNNRTSKGNVILEMLRLLLKHGADPNLVGYNNFRALELARSVACTELVELLLAAGADPAARPFV